MAVLSQRTIRCPAKARPMILTAYMVVAVLPIATIVAIAETPDEEAQGGTREATVLNIALLCLAVAALTVIEVMLL